MIVLFTDFGLQGPYTGQMKAVLHQMAPGMSIIDLFADAPAGNPKAAAYLLAAGQRPVGADRAPRRNGAQLGHRP
jgi:S-adenosylmethionine hydrolase